MTNRAEDGKNTLISAVLYSISNIVSVLISIVIIPILSNIMGTDDLGIATTFITTLGIVSYVCLFSLQSSINRAFLDFKEDKNEYMSSIYIFTSISTVVVFLLYLLFHSFINSLLGFSTNMMILMFLIIFGINGYYLTMAKWNFENKYKNTFICTLLSSPISQILSLVLVLSFVNNKYLGRIIGTQFFSVFLGIIFGILLIRNGKAVFKKKYIRYGLAISIPLLPHLISQTLLANFDLLMIKRMVGASEAGIYSMAYTISNVFLIVINQLLSPWSPWVYRRMDNKETDSIKESSNLIVVIAALACVGLFTIAPELIHLFLNADYDKAVYLIAPICVGMFFQVFYILFYNIQYFYKKNIRIAIFSVIACICNVILNYFGIKWFGYEAAAYTTLISYFILSILHFIGMKLITKEKIYDEKFIFGLGFLVIIISLLSVYFVGNPLLRYLLLVIMSLFIFVLQGKNLKKYSKMFISIFKKNK